MKAVDSRREAGTSPVSSYLHLCRCLDPGSPEPALAGPVDWREVLRFADLEMVTPVLRRALVNKQALERISERAAGYLERTYRINAVKNERLRDQALEAIAGLNDRGIVPLVFKGALNLLEADADPAARFMYDLDLMIPEADVDQGLEALRAIGYRADPSKRDRSDWTYCYWPLFRPGSLAPLELHTRPGEQRDFLAPDEVWREAVEVPLEAGRVRTLSPSHRVAHNVFHSQISDRGHSLALVWLKQLVDLADLCRRHASRIDWPAVIERMERHHLGGVLEARLHAAHRLLGLALPPGIEPGRKSERHLARCLRRIRWGRLREATLAWQHATEAFNRHHIDLMYDCHGDPVRIQLGRARHALRLLDRHRGDAWRLALRRGGPRN